MTRILAIITSALLGGSVIAADTDESVEPDNALRDILRGVTPERFDVDRLSPADALRRMQEDQANPDAWLEDPFGHLEQRMEWVVVDLERPRHDEPVQEEQDRIVAKLNRLIELLEKASGGSGGGGSTTPMRDSQISGGPGGVGELRDPNRSKRDWAELPPREREKVVQSSTEGFPAGYEALLEEYYRRLASEESASREPDESPGATP